MPTGAKIDNWTYLLGAFGASLIAHAVWMLVAPHHWFVTLPAGVPDFGPFNPHFVRDIGAAFLALGGMLLWGAFQPAVRLPALVVATLFNVAHSFVHVFDTATGYVKPEHWLIDLPLVYVPTVVLAALTVLLIRRTESPA